MELGSTDLNEVFKKMIQAHRCVPEPTRRFYWLKMLEAVQAVHQLGKFKAPRNFFYLFLGFMLQPLDRFERRDPFGPQAGKLFGGRMRCQTHRLQHFQFDQQ